MRKKPQPAAFACLACDGGTMMPTPHGHRCRVCNHFENDGSGYSVMEKDRGQDQTFCGCGWCKSGKAVKNQPSAPTV